MRQLLDRLGHQLEEMLLYCRFQGQLCGPRNFSTVSVCRLNFMVTDAVMEVLVVNFPLVVNYKLAVVFLQVCFVSAVQTDTN